ncbi:MAG TPA: polysaccharide biosynthesis/export family protein [Terriglobales bacterium]|nr:polysaccharide biosynthesis/export family protein [Terriglobales bacterium]
MPTRNARGVLRCCCLVTLTCTTLAFAGGQSPAVSEGLASSATKLGTQANSSEAALDTSLRLGPGDLVEFSVYNVPELASKARVSSNGDVYLPLIDYVHLAGLTLEEAQALLEKRYTDGGFLKDPHITLFVDEYASQGASVLGEVAKPGVYPVLGEQRLFDLISSAGGLSEKAGKSITVMHRNQPDKPVTVALSRNMSDHPESNVPVHPGDTVIVRRSDVVYVVGDVGRPSGFLMDGGSVTVLQAIALAGGTNRTAKLSGAKIIRKGSENAVHLKQILEAKAPDIPMQADDILFVPTSSGKIIAGRTLEAALQAASAVSIVAVRP